MPESSAKELFPEGLDTSFQGVRERMLDSLELSGLLSDRTPGSVLRTLVETFSREMATFYTALTLAHDSGYLDTAQGTALDKVVAMLGVTRTRAGRLTGRVALSRATPAPDDIIIPAGLRVSGPALSVTVKGRAEQITPILEVAEQAVLRRGERRVIVIAQETQDLDLAAIPSLAPGALNQLPRPLLGVETISNPDPILRGGADEPDESLRARARVALRAGEQATRESIEAAVRAQGVQQVTVEEPQDGPAGQLIVRISDPGFEEDDARKESVNDAIRATKAAGVRASVIYLTTVYFAPEILIEVEDEQMTTEHPDWLALRAELDAGVRRYVTGLGAGSKILLDKLRATALAIPKVRAVSILETPALGTLAQLDAFTARFRAGVGWELEAHETPAMHPTFSAKIRLKAVSRARLNVSVSMKNNAMPLATLQESVRAALTAWFNTLPPDPSVTPTQRTIKLSKAESALKDKTLTQAVKAMQLVHELDGASEDITSTTDAAVLGEERFIVGRVTVTVESA
ncbi:MAG: hypothetical protein RIT28_3573 [Pseudomonadota bacterium]